MAQGIELMTKRQAVESMPWRQLLPAMASRLWHGCRQATPLATRGEPGRNAQCPCGSGLKYKRCCMVAANPHDE